MTRPPRSILVTGGFGFIGSHLVEALLADSDAAIHVVDSLSTNLIDVNAYLRRLGDPSRLTYSACAIKEYLPKNGDSRFDEIYHLACVVGPVGVLDHAGYILRSAVDDTYAIAEYAADTRAKLCNISTSEVYGGGRDGYCSEKDSMIIPPKMSVRLEYAVAKLACEVALVNMARTKGLHATIVRPFNVAGPRQSGRGGFVIPRFIQQALAGKPLTIYGDGRMIRAFTHVRDMADGIIRTMRLGRSGEAYNIGNPANKITILALAQKIVEIVGKGAISFVDPKELWGPLFEEANDKYPDADKAMMELGWCPRYGIEDAIKETVEYIRAGRND